MTVAEIIRRLGGATVLAERLGFPGADVGAKRIRAWALRNSIPGEYWASVSAYSKEAGKGVTLEVLASVHAAGPERAAA